jgi:cytochrome c
VTEAMTARACTAHPGRGLLCVAAVSVFALFGMAANAMDRSAGDAQRGQQVFQRCYACHSVEPGESNLEAPNLAGVIGRTAGTLAAFPDYSEAMKASGRRGLVWDARTLEAFLEEPERVVPDTRMNFVALRSKQDRDDVIAYLQQATP